MILESETASFLEGSIARALSEFGEGCPLTIADALFPGLIEDSGAFRAKMDEISAVLGRMKEQGMAVSTGEFCGVEFFRAGTAPKPAEIVQADGPTDSVEDTVLGILKGGSLTASDITARLFPRDERFRARTSQVYVSLKRLEKKGLVLKGERKEGKQYYMCAADEKSAEDAEPVGGAEIPIIAAEQTPEAVNPIEGADSTETENMSQPTTEDITEERLELPEQMAVTVPQSGLTGAAHPKAAAVATLLIIAILGLFFAASNLNGLTGMFLADTAVHAPALEQPNATTAKQPAQAPAPISHKEINNIEPTFKRGLM